MIEKFQFTINDIQLNAGPNFYDWFSGLDSGGQASELYSSPLTELMTSDNILDNIKPTSLQLKDIPQLLSVNDNCLFFMIDNKGEQRAVLLFAGNPDIKIISLPVIDATEWGLPVTLYSSTPI